MDRVGGQIWDGGHVLFDRVVGYLALEEGNGPIEAVGCLEIHQGGILGGGLGLATNRPYRLSLEDGRSREIQITKVHASNSAGIVRIEFRIPRGSLEPGTAC